MVGMIALSSSLIGHLVTDMNMLERIVLFGGGLLMIIPGAVTDLSGLAIFLFSIILQKRHQKNQ